MKNTKSKKKTPPVRIIPLGGLNEIGKNITVYEYKNDLIIVDCGIAFPEDDMLGIDVVIPDMTYIKENINRVKGLFVTHAHEDHIGAIPYLLKIADIPIYATKFTIGMIKSKLKEHRIEPNTTEIKPGEFIKIGAFTIEPIRVNHSTPDAVAFAIETPHGIIIQTGDFKIDYNPIDGQVIDMARFAYYGQKGVLAMLSDSTNATHEGYTMSESTVGKTFDNLFNEEQESRIIIASFASNVHRIQQIINSAQLHSRKVAFSGRSMINNTNVASELGYLKLPKGIIIDIKDIDRYPDNEVVIVTTGSQGETMSALTRIASKEHKNVSIKDGDLVIFSSSPIPGNEKSIYRVINQLISLGANVVYDSLEEVHVSGHAKKEELKLILNLVKPKFFFPVHGEYMHLTAHMDLAKEMGVDPKKIHILSNGNGIELTKEESRLAEPVESGKILVDGLGVGDVGNTVLRERKRISEDGIINIALAFSKDGQPASSPQISSYGFVFIRESEALVEEINMCVRKFISKNKLNSLSEISSYKNKIRDNVGNLVYQRTKRKPVVMVIVLNV